MQETAQALQTVVVLRLGVAERVEQIGQRLQVAPDLKRDSLERYPKEQRAELQLFVLQL